VKWEKEVVKDFYKMMVGCLVCTLLVAMGFLALGRFDYTVVLGCLVGWTLAVGNYLMLSLGVMLALESGDQDRGKRQLRLCFFGRSALTVLVLAGAMYLEQIHPIPVLASVFFPRLVITAWRLLPLSGVGSRGWIGEREKAMETGRIFSEEEGDPLEKRWGTFFRASIEQDEENENSEGS